jgi:hypothetical protein
MTMATQAKNFRGSWRIVHMDTWDNDYPDLIEPAFIAFDKGGQGEFVFGAVKGWLDCRYGERNGRPVVEFSWEGVSEGDQICGRGWATQSSDGKLEGHLYIHNSDDSPFKAEKQ